jgi:hypothetical protein
VYNLDACCDTLLLLAIHRDDPLWYKSLEMTRLRYMRKELTPTTIEQQ